MSNRKRKYHSNMSLLAYGGIVDKYMFIDFLCDNFGLQNDDTVSFQDKLLNLIKRLAPDTKVDFSKDGLKSNFDFLLIHSGVIRTLFASFRIIHYTQADLFVGIFLESPKSEEKSSCTQTEGMPLEKFLLHQKEKKIDDVDNFLLSLHCHNAQMYVFDYKDIETRYRL
jgi:hypothetical protein